jgi:hypothetical protein
VYEVPFIVRDPDIDKDPVNSCVFVTMLPKWVEPVTNSIEEEIV